MKTKGSPAANRAASKPHATALVADVAVSSATMTSSALASTAGAVTSVTTLAALISHAGRDGGSGIVDSGLVMSQPCRTNATTVVSDVGIAFRDAAEPCGLVVKIAAADDVGVGHDAAGCAGQP